ncbi:MAG: apolipoprotein N-acyltransferase [Deltaproteobacteria bacterium]|nr:apolipoprotein N-acyltransferase [Deltaproteobacteria bacterium]
MESSRSASPRRGSGIQFLLTCTAIFASAIAFRFYARVEWPWFALGWIGFVPWLWTLDRAPSWRAALIAGVLMCEAFTLAVFSWFAVAIQNYTGASLVLCVGIVLLLAPLLQPQLWMFALLRWWIGRCSAPSWRPKIVIGACVYVGCEWLWPKLFGDTIGHGFFASRLLRQAADLVGAHGLTFVLIVANECVLEALMRLRRGDHPLTPSLARRRFLPPLIIPASIIAVLSIYGAVRIAQLTNGVDAKPVTAALIQADISRYERLAAQLGTFDAVRTILDAHFKLTAAALERTAVDFAVWPETVYPTTFGSPKSEDGAAFDREIAAFAADHNLPLIFGAYDVENEREFNAAFFLQRDDNRQLSFETYRKASLFPLTERVPAWLDIEPVRRRLPWLGTWKPGAAPDVVVLRLNEGRTLKVAPLICYDAVDPRLTIDAVRHGAEMIVTISNDSWFASGGGPRLHLVVSAFRTLETRRPQVRATNTGISAIIDATGDIAALADVGERTALIASVAPADHRQTLLLAWGDWFPPAAFVLAVAGLVRVRGQSRKFVQKVGNACIQNPP